MKKEITLTRNQNFISLDFKEYDEIQIITQKNKKLKVIEDLNEESNNKIKVEINVAKGAQITYISISERKSQTKISRVSNVAENGSINWIEGLIQGKNNNYQTITNLEGLNAKTNHTSLICADRSQNITLNVAINHKSQNTNSKIITKGTADNLSKVNQIGLIKIYPGCQNCSGSQVSDFILLNKNAKVTTTPNLEILNQNVSCTHSASIGRIDKDQLFYLTSRGLNKAQATQIIIQGFFEPLLKLTDCNIKRMLEDKMVTTIC